MCSSRGRASFLLLGIGSKRRFFLVAVVASSIFAHRHVCQSLPVSKLCSRLATQGIETLEKFAFEILLVVIGSRHLHNFHFLLGPHKGFFC
jgi:hypothetical protein